MCVKSNRPSNGAESMNGFLRRESENPSLQLMNGMERNGCSVRGEFIHRVGKAPRGASSRPTVNPLDAASAQSRILENRRARRGRGEAAETSAECLFRVHAPRIKSS